MSLMPFWHGTLVLCYPGIIYTQIKFYVNMKLLVASWNVINIAHKPDLVNKEHKTVDPDFKTYINPHDIIGL